MPRTPSGNGGGKGAGFDLARPLSWPLRPASSLGLLEDSPTPGRADSLRWDPAWAWEQLADSPRNCRLPLELLAQANWWTVQSEVESDALDRLWRHSVAS